MLCLRKAQRNNSQTPHDYIKKCAEHFNESQAENIYSPTIYLCPNCHAYVHLAMNEKLKDFTDDLVDITPNIFSKILDVVGMMKMQETCISLYSEETNVSRYQ